MSPDREALRALSEAATPGPWSVEWELVMGADHLLTADCGTGGDERSNEQRSADAAFIAAAVNYVRALLAAAPAPTDQRIAARHVGPGILVPCSCGVLGEHTHPAPAPTETP